MWFRLFLSYIFSVLSSICISISAYAGLQEASSSTEPAAFLFRKNKIHFTPEEDELLKSLVEQSPKIRGKLSWSLLARFYNQRLVGRQVNWPRKTNKQLRERYVNYLADNIKNEPFNNVESSLLFQLATKFYIENGVKFKIPWTQWASLYFSGRKEHHLKNVYNTDEFRKKLIERFIEIHKQVRNSPEQTKCVEDILAVISRDRMLKVKQPRRKRSQQEIDAGGKRVAALIDMASAQHEQQLSFQPGTPQRLEEDEVGGDMYDPYSLPQLCALLSSDAGHQSEDPATTTSLVQATQMAVSTIPTESEGAPEQLLCPENGDGQWNNLLNFS